jgi:hypothetical protein
VAPSDHALQEMGLFGKLLASKLFKMVLVTHCQSQCGAITGGFFDTLYFGKLKRFKQADLDGTAMLMKNDSALDAVSRIFDEPASFVDECVEVFNTVVKNGCAGQERVMTHGDAVAVSKHFPHNIALGVLESAAPMLELMGFNADSWRPFIKTVTKEDTGLLLLFAKTLSYLNTICVCFCYVNKVVFASGDLEILRDGESRMNKNVAYAMTMWP